MASQATSKSYSDYIWEEFALHEKSFTFEKFALCGRFSIASEDEFFFLSLRPLFDLIQNAQEFDLQCRRIICQLHIHTQQGISLALVLWFLSQYYFVDKKSLLCYVNCVFISQQKSLQAQLLKMYHDTSSGDHFDHNKMLNLIWRHFIWLEMIKDVHKYITTCPICQSKAVHCHKLYKELEPLSISINLGNTSFKKISLN